jgi:hypothetical protein
MVWQRVLLLLIAVLLYFTASVQAQEKEPTAIIEIGGAQHQAREALRTLLFAVRWHSR